ncbi:MAG: hypothetical protein UV68_C0035G0007 [Candidatus Collierbacteria bacterium GW2011_GWC2_43_12]|uniref:Uncharacterized protein n=1 Tax=Candidatus Collierbacteria bacterium GW2011_GWC2_43_12 TaxID=1618390 RepID=A0A0G1D519_9BACT|nr:MAG: hypothetical protein UV68_C0035G0007 [Candidatus Collierbacteria bacterium GW2011_GWC2_43_12]
MGYIISAVERLIRSYRNVELSPEEKRGYSLHWEALKTNGAREGYRAEKAKFEIFRMGRKILPLLLRDTKQEASEYMWNAVSEILSCLAEETDRSTILELITDKRALGEDETQMYNLLKALNKINFRVRSGSEHDQRLDECVDVLEYIYQRSHNGDTQSRILLAMSIAGGEKARCFISANNRWGGFYAYEKYLRDVSMADLYAVKRVITDPEKDYFEYIEVDRGLAETRWLDLTRRAEDIVFRACEISETTREALLMYAFNFLRSHPKMSGQERKRLVRRLKILSKEEEKYRSAEVPLPTVGLELEIPLVPDREIYQEIIEALQIKTYDEQEDLWEVINAFSYSSGLQMRVLEELIKMRAMPIADPEIRNIFYKEMMLSLHINLGVPKDIEGVIGEFDEEIDILVDGLVYGFVSPLRLRHRKTRNDGISWDIKDHEVQKSEKSGKKRLEIKVTEFSDATSYRMIDEAQILAGAMFAYIKNQLGLPVSSIEKEMAGEWACHRLCITKILNSHRLMPKLYNCHPESAVEAAKNLKLRKEMRKAVDGCSAVIKKIVFG